MVDTKDIIDVIVFFQRAFTVIFALALAEAFKQFIADKAEKEDERVIHWNRIWALISFLFLIFPFFQGTNRYLFLEYLNGRMPKHFGKWIMFDGIIFMIEAALFF
jgi:hypothetical protein